ncbi:T9SS type A sorting domain-containing protein [Mangrovimonas aestuarii]|uniref:T9SS type A sorting domain-containing protein n=1 Tax=Mangrovimonas aestuarii TaxID=3018443 RepID=UPI002378B35F|nr:T9SS type A sorting domain-containing protein [Mangrovimonas aestuarii]
MKRITSLSLGLFSILFINLMACLAPIQAQTSSNVIQRIRINCTTPQGYVRQLLLAFIPNNGATDGFDYGYDALNMDDFPDDINWMIGEDRYVIQGVGNFNSTKQYPLGLFLTNSGNISISLNSLENFDTPIDLYIYDSELDIYTQINDTDFITNIANGDFTNRFYLTFINDSNSSSPNDNTLGVDDTYQNKQLELKYNSITKQLILNTNSHEHKIQSVTVFNLSGKKLISKQLNEKCEATIHLNSILSSPIILQIATNKGTTTKKVIVN